jgi:hypothetical protein
METENLSRGTTQVISEELPSASSVKAVMASGQPRLQIMVCPHLFLVAAAAKPKTEKWPECQLERARQLRRELREGL